MNVKERPVSVRYLIQLGLLALAEAIICFTPLGALPAVGPIPFTLGLAPVVVTAVLMGPAAGSVMGFLAGFFSFLVWSFSPPGNVAFLFTPFSPSGGISGNFWSLVICFVPRILAGTLAGVAFRGIRRFRPERKSWAFLGAGILGSAVNTLGVLGGAYLFFSGAYAESQGAPASLVLTLIAGIVLTNGLPEAAINGVAALFVGRPLQRLVTRNFFVDRESPEEEEED